MQAKQREIIIIMERKNKGCLYWDESSRGIKSGKTDRRGRWCAEKRIDGKLVRKRSGDIQKCIDFLNDCDEVSEHKPQRTVQVPTFHDRRFMMHKGHIASMEQRKQLLKDRITESDLTLRYFETRDFTDINTYIGTVILPRLNVYCVERLHMAKDMQKVILQCVAIFYTYLYADVPVFGYEWKLRAMLRYWKEHGDLGYYEKIPEPIHEAIGTLDISALEKRFTVKHNR